MQRGELYLIPRATSSAKSGPRIPGVDPKKQRVYVVVSRQFLVDSRFATVICAPVLSEHDGLSTQVQVGVESGLKHESSIHCDELASFPKSRLTNYIGRLSPGKIEDLNRALADALDLGPNIYI